jgi:hypothetical protein
MLVERWLLRGVGSLGGLGGIAFLLAHLPAIGVYLLAAGAALWGFTWKWHHRFDRVSDQPPPDWQATGERYWDPGRGQWVAVWAAEAGRVYVPIPDTASPTEGQG